MTSRDKTDNDITHSKIDATRSFVLFPPPPIFTTGARPAAKYGPTLGQQIRKITSRVKNSKRERNGTDDVMEKKEVGLNSALAFSFRGR